MSEIDRTPLSDDERRDLELAEQVVRDGLDKFRAVGGALLSIRDRRLYRERYATFEEYCDRRFDIGRRRGYQLIRAAEVCRDIEEAAAEPPTQSFTITYVPASPDDGDGDGVRTMVHTAGPDNERQARPLVPLAKEQRQEAWSAACAAAGPDRPPTHREVEAAARKVAGLPEPRPCVRIAVDPADLAGTAEDIIRALGRDGPAINNLIRHIADLADDPLFQWAMLRRPGRRRR